MLEHKRKFLIAATALVMSFALILLGYIDGDNWVMVTSAIVGLYSASNVGVAVARRNHDRHPVGRDPTPPYDA